MKKKICFAGAILVLAAATATGYSAYNKNDVSELLNANIEALASGEAGEVCYNTITERTSVYTLYCGTCTVISGEPSWVSGKGKCN